MSKMGKLQGPLAEAVGTAGYTMAVGLYTVMVSKGIMTKAEARKDFKRWAEKAKRLEGTANKDAAVILKDLAKYINVWTSPKEGRKGGRKGKKK
jgi:hypothetical protein